jgi:hypothetical protein
MVSSLQNRGTQATGNTWNSRDANNTSTPATKGMPQTLETFAGWRGTSTAVRTATTTARGILDTAWIPGTSTAAADRQKHKKDTRAGGNNRRDLNKSGTLATTRTPASAENTTNNSYDPTAITLPTAE